MAKRFCDTELWNKDWYLKLNAKKKLLIKFLYDNCDCAGFYEVSWTKLNFFFGEEIKKEDFLDLKKVKFINEKVIFIENFILFQYNIKSFNELNPKNNAHKGVLRILKNYGFEISPTEAPNEPLESPLQGVIGRRKKEEGYDSLLINSLNEEERKEIKKEKKENLSSSLKTSEKKLNFPNAKTSKKPKDQAFRANLVKLYKERERLKERNGVLSG